MEPLTGTVVSVHTGGSGSLEKAACQGIEFALDGVVGDRHRGLSRCCWSGDKQAEGVERRNERQWSAISAEELEAISATMELAEPLQAATLGVNLCLAGVGELSRLPRGTLLSFSSGVVLMVEEYNPPCADMGAEIARLHRHSSGQQLAAEAFSQAAKFSRGLVGVVEVAGSVAVGDTFRVEPEQLPKWLR